MLDLDDSQWPHGRLPSWLLELMRFAARSGWEQTGKDMDWVALKFTFQRNNTTVIFSQNENGSSRVLFNTSSKHEFKYDNLYENFYEHTPLKLKYQREFNVWSRNIKSCLS